MSRPRAYAAALGGALALVALIVGAHGLVDRIERDTEDRQAYRQWVQDACIPTRRGDRAIILHEGARLTCTIYSDYQRGLVPHIVSAAVMEAPL